MWKDDRPNDASPRLSLTLSRLASPSCLLITFVGDDMLERLRPPASIGRSKHYFSCRQRIYTSFSPGPSQETLPAEVVLKGAKKTLEEYCRSKGLKGRSIALSSILAPKKHMKSA